MFFTVGVFTKSLMGPFFLEKNTVRKGKMECEIEVFRGRG